MTSYRYSGDYPAVFPSLTNADGSTVSVDPGDVVELGDQAVIHALLTPADRQAQPPDPLPAPAVEAPPEQAGLSVAPKSDDPTEEPAK